MSLRSGPVKSFRLSLPLSMGRLGAEARIRALRNSSDGSPCGSKGTAAMARELGGCGGRLGEQAGRAIDLPEWETLCFDRG